MCLVIIIIIIIIASANTLGLAAIHIGSSQRGV